MAKKRVLKFDEVATVKQRIKKIREQRALSSRQKKEKTGEVLWQI